MFRYRFLRNSFFLTMFLVILLPLHALLVTHPTFQFLLTRFTEENAVRVAHFMAQSVMAQNGQVPGLVLTEAFKTEMAQTALAFHLFKYRLFDAHGQILHSSDQTEIGTHNNHSYFHKIVATGKPYSLTVEKNHKTLENDVLKLDVVETYVPIMRGNTFLGAFEIYFDVTEWRKKLDAGVTQSSLILSSMAGIFFLVVMSTRFSVMRRVGLFMEAIRETSQGDFHRRIPVSGRDELTDMANAFNMMSRELHKLHNGLQNEKNKLTTIIHSAREGIVVTDSQGQVVLVNPAAEHLLGKTEEAIRQQGFLSLVDDPDFIRHFLERQGVDVARTIVFNAHVLHFYASTIFDEDGVKVGSAALLRDITAEKNLEDKLRNLSITDGLTGLFNRRHTDETLHKEWLRSQRTGQGFAFLLIDVDHFKRFNDQHGHDQGDRVLQAVAKTMQSLFRHIDFCCRFGGEEFCVIMLDASQPGAMDAANRLRTRIAETSVDGLQVTVSIGVSLYPQSATTVEQLVKRADEALYQAKQMGRNRVEYMEQHEDG